MKSNNIEWDHVYPEEPDVVKKAVGRALNQIAKEPETGDNVINYPKKKVKKYSLALVASVSLFAILSGFAFASLLYKQRMEKLSDREVIDYYQVIMENTIVRYNRKLSEDEQKRMDELRKEYEQNGRFPVSEISFVSQKEYSGMGIGFDTEKSVFLIPEMDLTDEELLQIIDFYEKGDYSVRKVNEQAELAEEIQEKPQNSPLSMTEFEKYNDTLNYRAVTLKNSETIYYEAANSEYLYLAGNHQITRYVHGNIDGELFFETNNDERIMAIYADHSGLYVSIINKDRSLPTKLIRLNRNGQTETEFNLEAVYDGEGNSLSTCIPYKMTSDQEGRLYIKFRDYSKEGTLAYGFNSKGEYIGEITAEGYNTANWQGMCSDDSNLLYVLATQKESDDGLVLLSVNPSDLKIEKCQELNSLDATVYFDAMTVSSEEYRIAGYDGVYHFDATDSHIICSIHGYDEKWFGEGSRYIFADQDTLIILKSSALKEDALAETELIYLQY